MTKDLSAVYWDENGCAIDHLGNRFSSASSMCTTYEVDAATFQWRISNGWTLERALTEGTNPPDNIVGDAIYVLGVYYPTYSAIATKFEFSIQTVIDHADDLESWLLEAKGIPFDGKFFKSLTELAREYDITVSSLARRLELGWELRDAIMTPMRDFGNGKPAQDHLGNWYPTIQDMLVVYKISYGAYKNRLKKNWSLERTLTTPVRGMKRANKFSAKLAGT